jgi:hypothetical protein
MVKSTNYEATHNAVFSSLLLLHLRLLKIKILMEARGRSDVEEAKPPVHKASYPLLFFDGVNYIT